MKHRGAVYAALIMPLLAVAPPPIAAAPTTKVPSASNAVDMTVKGHILQPADLPPPDPATLKVPSGFRVTRFAEHLGNVRMLAVSATGAIYVTRREEGDVLMLKDGGDGKTAAAPVRVVGRPGMHGIAFHEGKVYLATPKQIFRAPVLPDGMFGPLEMLIHDLPDAGQHNTRTVQIGPDGMMYIAVGSTCNECLETNPENATLLRAPLTGKSRSIFASGLRDTIGWGWHPQTGELWGMDQGMDWLGDDLPPEELNHIERGHRYGWPHVWGNNQLNPHIHPIAEIKPNEWLAKSTPMVLGYTAHAAPMQMAFYAGAQFPPAYRGDAFIAMRGSWNRKPVSGYQIVRIRFKDGQATGFEPFVSGFAGAKGQSARPCGVAVAADGALLFTDDRNGIIYRVAYDAGKGSASSSAPGTTPAPSLPPTPPPGPMREQAARGSGVPLAVARPELATPGKLSVSSPAFAAGAAIPAMYSEYEQGASLPLIWSAGPTGTRAYVVIVEDPDAKPPSPQPVIHWVAWNIPADVTSLPEGLPKQEALTDPAGIRQGPNSSGAIGYRGPKPPAGDPAHHYHVQLFAIDRSLDLAVGSNRDDVIAAMKGHVLAAGELVGPFKRPDNPSRP